MTTVHKRRCFVALSADYESGRLPGPGPFHGPSLRPPMRPMPGCRITGLCKPPAQPVLDRSSVELSVVQALQACPRGARKQG